MLVNPVTATEPIEDEHVDLDPAVRLVPEVLVDPEVRVDPEGVQDPWTDEYDGRCLNCGTRQAEPWGVECRRCRIWVRTSLGGIALALSLVWVATCYG